jgi:hypothetical protein
MADHIENLSHDSVNRFLRGKELSSELLYERVDEDIIYCESGYIMADDTVLDKDYSHKIEMVRRQYSGNAHRLIKGIGVVNCVYYNPELNRFWLVDFRIFNPDEDKKTKIDHLFDMLAAIKERGIKYKYALMDSWYATKEVMLEFMKEGTIFYCPLKDNRHVDDTQAKESFKRVDTLQWSESEKETGKTIKIKGFPGDTRLQLFQVFISTNKLEYIVTNDPNVNKTDGTNREEVENQLLLTTLDVRKHTAFRWKIEQLHREEKQLTGIERCQCRSKTAQKNHILCAILVWNCLKNYANQFQKTVYEIKHSIFDYAISMALKYPMFTFA